MSSILTNHSAIVALQTLKSINSGLTKAQSEISTGKAVGSAKDNAAVWAISKVMESDESGFRAVQKSLNVANAVVGTALTGAEQITKLLQEMKALAISGNNDAAEFGKINADIQAKKTQITSIIAGTQMNGVNLLKTDVAGASVTNYSVTGSLDRTFGTATPVAAPITVASVNFQAGGIQNITIDPITTRAEAATALGQIESMLTIAISGATALGTSAKQIADQADFVGKLADSLKIGVSTLVDADIEEASARLQALQTQQQLGIQSLSIANQAPSAILALFR